jgi:predicted GTPase
VNPRAAVVRGALRISAEHPERLRGTKVLVVEDGPTLTHGGMPFGAATLLARAHGAEIVDARKAATGSIAAVYAQYPHLDRVLPAMGYSPTQVHELEATIRGSSAEVVLDGSPVNLARLVHVPQPIVNVRYDYDDLEGRLAERLRSFVAGLKTP